MNVTIPTADLLRGMRLAASVADRKSTMPMLANVLLRATGKGRLTLTATDLNVSSTESLDSDNTAEGGMCLNAKVLCDLVGNAPGDTVTIRKTENNWAEIQSGKAKYKLVGMAATDFPKSTNIGDSKAFAIDSNAFGLMIDRTIFSVCNDETRFHLSGVLLESDGDTMRMVSTDGHRLSKVEQAIAGPKLPSGVIVPRAGLAAIRKVLALGDSCRLAIEGGHLFAAHKGTSISVKLIDAKFPPYEQVIPKGHDKDLIVDRGRLADAIGRAKLMSSETRGVQVTASNGLLTLTSNNPDLGEVSEEIEAEYDGDRITVGWNPKYVSELLGAMQGDQCVLHFGGELDPILIDGDPGYLGVVMPMRV
jgi:DNA polymerase-3 subunit beta